MTIVGTGKTRVRSFQSCLKDVKYTYDAPVMFESAEQASQASADKHSRFKDSTKYNYDC